MDLSVFDCFSLIRKKPNDWGLTNTSTLHNLELQTPLLRNSTSKLIALLARLPEPLQTLLLITKINIAALLRSKFRSGRNTARWEATRSVAVDRDVSLGSRVVAVACVALGLSAEPFYRCSGARTGGKGLGVAVVFCWGGRGVRGGWVVVSG